MDDGFQFIIESPQHSTGHKKRPRLVTSCDNCRLKKIKCLQSAPESKCEACRTAKISCRFKDRERYFAERSRAIAGPPPYGDDAGGRSSTNSPKPSGVVVPEGDYYSSSVHRRSVDASRRAVPPPAAAPHPAHHPSNGLQQRPAQLFDPDRPQFPHSNYMSHFIALFFEQLANDFQFLSYNDISRAYWDQLLSPYLANAIAAMAARYSTHPDLTVRGVHNVADAYAENAKAIFPSVAHILTMDNLHATILVGWYEFKVNRLAGLRTYAQMAMQMAIDQGLSDETVANRLALGESERQRRNLTWNGVYSLQMTANQTTLPMNR